MFNFKVPNLFLSHFDTVTAFWIFLLSSNFSINLSLSPPFTPTQIRSICHDSFIGFCNRILLIAWTARDFFLKELSHLAKRKNVSSSKKFGFFITKNPMLLTFLTHSVRKEHEKVEAKENWTSFFSKNMFYWWQKYVWQKYICIG